LKPTHRNKSKSYKSKDQSTTALTTGCSGSYHLIFCVTHAGDECALVLLWRVDSFRFFFFFWYSVLRLSCDGEKVGAGIIGSQWLKELGILWGGGG